MTPETAENSSSEETKGKSLILNVGSGVMDFGGVRLDIVKHRNVNVVADGERLPFRDCVFDVVYSRSFLEHTLNPQRALEEQHRVLKPRGTLMLITDNAGYWRFHVFGTHVKPTTRLGGQRFYLGISSMDTHFSLFTREHLRQRLEKIGLKIEELSLELHGFSGKPHKMDRILAMFKIAENLTHPRIKIVSTKREMESIPFKTTQ